MKAVVIGANGFLGVNLVHELLERGFEIVAVYNKEYKNIDERCELVSFQNIGEINPVNIDAVFYLSGSFLSSYEDLININCHQLSYVSDRFEAAKLIYVSSANVYGDLSTTISEDSCYCNPGKYGLSKLAGEFIAKNHSKYAIMRLCYLYGPRLNNNSFVPRLIKQARETGEIVLFGSGKREQDYLYVDDAVKMCHAAYEYDHNDVFLGATGMSYSNYYIADLIRTKELGINIKYEGVDSGKSIYFNPEITFKKLKWEPKTSLEAGIQNMWNASNDLW